VKEDNGVSALPTGPAPQGAEPQASQAKPLVPDAGWVVLGEHNYAIRFWLEPEYRLGLNFKVFSAAEGWHSDEDTSKPGTWELFGGNDGWLFEEWEQAFWEIDGGLKWDGCINWQTNGQCMVHGCTPRHADAITAIFQTIYHVGKRYFDLLGDDVPPLPEGAFDMFDAIATGTRRAETGTGSVHEGAGLKGIAKPLVSIPSTPSL